MKKSIKKLSDSLLEIAVTLEATELQAAEKIATDELTKDVKVKGFRQGKAPASVAKNQIDPMQLANRIAEIAINDNLVKIIQEEKIRPLDRPEVELGNFTPSKELKFVAKIAVVPQIKLPNYKKLDVKKPELKINAKDVDRTIENLLIGGATKKAVKRAAKTGDEAVIDFVGRFAGKNGKEFPGGAGKDFALKLGSKQFIPGFEEAIVGHKTDEEFDIPLAFPEDYQAQNLANKKVIFKVKIKKLNELKLPELDDKFASSLGAEHIKTVADLKADIKKELRAREMSHIEEQFQNALIEKLVKKTTLEVPDILIEDQIQPMENEIAQSLVYQQKTIDDYLKEKKFKNREEWIEKELKPVAAQRAKAGLLLAEIANVEKIVVNDIEVDARIQAIQAQYNDPQLKSMYENDNAKRQIANQIATEKTLQFLADENS